MANAAGFVFYPTFYRQRKEMLRRSAEIGAILVGKMSKAY